MTPAVVTAGDAAILDDILCEGVALEFLGKRVTLSVPQIRDTLAVSQRFTAALARSQPKEKGGKPELSGEEQALEYMELAVECLLICNVHLDGKRLLPGQAGKVVVHELAQPGVSLAKLAGTVTGEAWSLVGLPALRVPEKGEETPGDEEAEPTETANRPFSSAA